MNPYNLSPADLHLAILENNPEGVISRAQERGLNVGPEMDPATILGAIYTLDTGDFEEFIVDLVAIFNVPVNLDGPFAEELIELSSANLGCVVQSNAMANAPESYRLISDEEYGRMKVLSLIGLIAIAVFAVAFVLRIVRGRKGGSKSES